jgi:hypothetical protein
MAANNGRHATRNFVNLPMKKANTGLRPALALIIQAYRRLRSRHCRRANSAPRSDRDGLELQADQVGMAMLLAADYAGVDVLAAHALQRQEEHDPLAGVEGAIDDRPKSAAGNILHVQAVNHVAAIGIQTNAPECHLQLSAGVSPSFHWKLYRACHVRCSYPAVRQQTHHLRFAAG